MGYYEHFVYSAACRALKDGGGDPSEGEDVAQEAFLKIWQKGTSYRGECPLAGWIYRVTVNTARDHIRRNCREETVPLTRWDGEEDGIWELPVTSEEELPEEAVLRKERAAAIHHGLAALPEDTRRVIVLRDIHGFAYSEIAEILGIAEGTVKSRLNRGRRSLKVWLIRHDGEGI